MRIAIFSDTFFPDQVNGVARAASESARVLANLGHEVVVFTVAPGLGQKSNVSGNQYKVIQVPSIPAPGYSSLRATMPPFSLMYKQVKQFNPNIIHIHTPFAVGNEGLKAGRRLKVPIVGTHHTFFDHYLKHVYLDYSWFRKLSWKFLVRFYNQCDLVLSPSTAMSEQIQSHGLHKPIQVFLNAVNTEFFHPSTHPPGQNLIYMGRTSYEKSIHRILEAFAVITKSAPAAKLQIVGDGPEKIKLKKLAQDLQVEKKVTFTGFILGEKLAEVLAGSDIFLTASASENQPMSILEAMASGLPVIGVDALGVPEVVKNGVNGFIVPPDRTDLFAEKTLELLKSPQLLKKFSTASRELSLNYSEETIGKKLEAVYQKLILRS